MTQPKLNAYKKLSITSGLYDMAYQIKKHQLRRKYPNRDEDWLHTATVDLIRKACK